MASLIDKWLIRIVLALTAVAASTYATASLLEAVHAPDIIALVLTINVLLFSLIVGLQWSQDYSRESGGLIAKLLIDALIKNIAFYAFLPIIYLPIRLLIGAAHWLRHGVFDQITMCGLTAMFCESKTQYLGLNRIFEWLGQNDPFYSMLPISLSIGLFWLYLNGEA